MMGNRQQAAEQRTAEQAEQKTINNKQPAFADAPAYVNALGLKSRCLLFIAYCSWSSPEVHA